MSKPKPRVHRPINATLYVDVRQRLRAVQRIKPDYAEMKAHTLHALLRQRKGYAKAAAGKNKHRVRWFLQAVPRLPHHLVLQYLPPGCIGAVELLKAALPERCTGVPHVTIEQLCLLVLEMAPAVVQMHS